MPKSYSNLTFTESAHIGLNDDTPEVPLKVIASLSSPDPLLTLYNDTNGGGSTILFSDQATTQAQKGRLTFYHSDGASYGGGASFNLTSTEDDLVLAVGDADATHGRVVVWSGQNNAEPDYGFAQDVDTGMLRSGANAMRFVTGGSSALDLDSSQNATFAGTITTTSTATGAITLNGGTGVSTTGAFILRQNGDGDGNGMAITSSNATSHRIWKDANGVLNIGSSSNSNAFQQDITGNVTIEGDVTVGDDVIMNSSGAVLTLGDSNTVTLTHSGGYGGTLASNSTSGAFVIDSAHDITLDADGGEVYLKDGGTTRYTFHLDSTPTLDISGDFAMGGSGDISIEPNDDLILKSGAGEHIRLDESATGGANTKFSIKTYHTDDVKACFGTGASSDGDWNIYADGGTYSDFILESVSSNTGVGNMILRNNYQGDIEFHSGGTTVFRCDGSSDALIVNTGDVQLEGTGRIQGVDTVTDSTDAANKAYVDAHTSGVQSIGVGTGLDITSGSTPTITLDTSEMTAIDGDDPEVVDIIVNDSDGGVPAKISKANFITAVIPRAQHIITSNWSDDQSSSTTYYYMPMNYIVDSSSTLYYNTWGAPTSGTVKYIMMMHTPGGTTMSSSFTTQLNVIKNGLSVATSGELTPSNGTNDGSYIEYSPNTTFSKGDRLGFRYQKSATSKYWRGVTASIIIEYDRI